MNHIEQAVKHVDLPHILKNSMEENTTLKHSALTAIHQKAGAKMVPFAGYLMPVQYTGINDEHETVRNAVGMFDVSHMLACLMSLTWENLF